MFPIGDDLPMLRRPWVTYGLLATLFAVWVLFQGAGMNNEWLAATACNWGMLPGEITHLAKVGTGFQVGPAAYCLVDNSPSNVLTPLTSMFLHGSWGHLLSNSLFLYVFGKSVEDSMGRFRFLALYLLCGLAAAAAHIAVDPASPIPTVGASGAIAGMLGTYLGLYPRARVRMLFIFFFFFRIFSLPSFFVLLWWAGMQVLGGLPQLTSLNPEVSAGIAFWAHVGGFVAGLLLARLFADRQKVERRRAWRQQYA